MKGNFYFPVELKTIDRQIKEHKPFAAVTLSTTGLDNASFKDHAPIRLVIKEYKYNEEFKEYEVTENSFDKIVKCPRTALENAIEQADKGGYDIFYHSGINRNDYINDVNVSSEDEFKRDFELYLDGVGKETLFVINGGYDFLLHYLEKDGCGDRVRQLKTDKQVCDLLSLSKQYFAEKGIAPSGKAPKLEEIDAVISGKDISQAEPIAGTDRRAWTIGKFLIKYGIEHNYLKEEDMEAFAAKMSQSLIDYYSEQGRRDYEGKSFTDKINAIYEMKDRATGKPVLDKAKILDKNSDCDISRLLRQMREGEKKGVIFMQAATTGFDRSQDLPLKVGEPIQFTAVAYNFDNGRLAQQKGGVAINIKASSSAIGKAQTLANTGKFDAFGYTGINIDDYLAGKKVNSPDKAVEKINKFFDEFSLDDYILVSNGRQEDGKLLTQHALSQLMNADVVSADCIDFTQIIKEYCVLVHEDVATYGSKNAILNPETYDEKDFSLESVAKHNNVDNIKSTKGRCACTAMLLDKIYAQQAELYPDIFKAIADKQAEIKAQQEQAQQQETPAEDEPAGYEDEPAPSSEPSYDEDTPSGYDEPESEPAGMPLSVSRRDMDEDRDAPSENDAPPSYRARAGMRNRPVRPRPDRDEYERRYSERYSRPDRPDGTERSDNSPDVSMLIKALAESNALNKALTEQIAVQNKVMEMFTDKLFGVVDKQTQTIELVVGLSESLNEKNVSAEKSEDKETLSVNEQLEKIKEQIDSVRSDVKNFRANQALVDANNSIHQSQRILEEPEKKKDED